MITIKRKSTLSVIATFTDSEDFQNYWENLQFQELYRVEME